MQTLETETSKEQDGNIFVIVWNDLIGLWHVLQPNKFQYALLILQVCIIGGTLGLITFPLAFIGGADDEDEFKIQSYMYSHAHIFVFGVSKALTNILVGLLSDKYGRRIPHTIGWIFGMCVPIMILLAKNWLTIVLSNIFLGLMQGLAWSTDLFMMIDYAGSKHRGIAVGMNETIGYCAIAAFKPIAAALATIGGGTHYRTNPYYLCLAMMALGFVLCFFLKDTMVVVRAENEPTLPDVAEIVGATSVDPITTNEDNEGPTISAWQVFIETSFLRRRLVACCQAGLMINFLVGMAWTLLVKWMKEDFDIKEIGGALLAFGILRGLSQLFTGYMGDQFGRRFLIFIGLFINAVMLLIFSVSVDFAKNKNEKFAIFTIGASFMGIGIGTAYPNLLAVVAEEAPHPSVRASSLGVYRLWRDMGYAIGAIISGSLIDALQSFSVVVGIVCGFTFASSFLFWFLYGSKQPTGR